MYPLSVSIQSGFLLFQLDKVEISRTDLVPLNLHNVPDARIAKHFGERAAVAAAHNQRAQRWWRLIAKLRLTLPCVPPLLLRARLSAFDPLRLLLLLLFRWRP